MSLDEYQRKRRFNETREPRGRTESTEGPLRFVVQKHDATRLHYDFRLELDGMLKSWAVPKGPSLNPADKRLAVQVEDHPVDYRTFEGTIPKGNYGAGDVIVWDEGTYEPSGSTSELRKGLNTGRLSFVLHGKKLNGEFSLVRMHGKGRRHPDKNWLLIKKQDKFASNKDVAIETGSARSQRTLRRDAPANSFVKPMLASLAAEPFDRTGWRFEVKWDGWRAIAELNGATVRLYSRNQVAFNESFPGVVASLKKLDRRAILDGEIVALDEQGRSRFQLLQMFRKTGRGRLAYVAFDLLELDGENLRKEPLATRQELLAGLIGRHGGLMLSEAVEERGIDFFQAACEHGLEGMIAKDASSPYRDGVRSSSWLKVKCESRQEAVIAGFTAPRGNRKNLGALVLGVFEKGGLRYIGHTGGGSSDALLADLRRTLDPLITDECPFPKAPKVNAPVRWVKPELVCEVRFQEWTDDGRMRHPIFLGLRSDKPAQVVTREVLVEPADEPPLTNLNKIYWPEDAIAKGDLIAYYRTIAPVILPCLRDRPLSLNRQPDGITGKSFFQKDVGRYRPPPWIATRRIASESRGEPIEWALCQDAKSLLYFANLGCIEMNPWNSRVASLDHPDYLIIDLDPSDVSFSEVIPVAKTVRAVLERAGAESFCKTSGKRGVHIVLPLDAQYTHDQSRQFAEVVTAMVLRKHPAITSTVRDPRQRKNRIYLDALQNRRGQTLASAYSVRPWPGGTVSTPLLWREVRKGLNPAKFTMTTIPERLDRLGDLWMGTLGPGIKLEDCIRRM